MGRVSDTCKEQIRTRVPLEELLREYNVQLVPVGRRLRALCPFHAEKTPSFYVDVERQTYHCYGCQEHGDAFRFIQKTHQLDFPQALELLARKAGVELDDVPGGRRRRSNDGPRIVEHYDVLEFASRFYQQFLMDDPAARPAREYLESRGLRRDTWQRFRLGFAPAQWDHLLGLASRQGFSAQLLEAVGLVRRREQGSGCYDYFRGRIMFPVADPQGRVLGFGARAMGDDVPKYLNSPRTALFDKSQVLYGLDIARTAVDREGRIGIVEGYTDAIMAHQEGLNFFVANLGTAFTRENARRLGRLAPRVLLVFDGDDAGQRASERSLDLLVAENLDVRVYAVTHGKDPCDAISQLGGEAFRQRLEKESVGIFEFKWRRTVESAREQESGPAIQARAMDEFLRLLARVPNVVARKLYLREFSERIGIPEQDIQARLREVRGSSQVRRSLGEWPGRGGSRSERPGGGKPSGRESLWHRSPSGSTTETGTFRNRGSQGASGDQGAPASPRPQRDAAEVRSSDRDRSSGRSTAGPRKGSGPYGRVGTLPEGGPPREPGSTGASNDSRRPTGPFPESSKESGILGAGRGGEGSQEVEGNSAVTGRDLREDPITERSGRSDRASGAGKQTKLEELVLECVVALSEQAGGLLDRLPEEFFEDPVTSHVARRVRELTREGAFSPATLLHELEDTEAADLLLRVIGRVGEVAEDPLADYEGVWARLQRDIWRSRRQRRAEALKTLIAQEAAERGQTERLLDLRKEYFETLKELKRGGGCRIGVGDESG